MENKKLEPGDKYLKENTMRSGDEQMVKRPQGGGPQPEAGSVRNIYDWLNKKQGTKEEEV